MTDLRPCPFCGGEAVIDHTSSGMNMASYVRCNKCYVKTKSIPMSTQYSSDEKAVILWNRRYADNDGNFNMRPDCCYRVSAHGMGDDEDYGLEGEQR